MRVKEPGAVRRLRVRRGFTQRELALLSKCSQTTIYLIEKGQMATLSDELATRIAKRLDVDVEDLFQERSASVAPAMSSVRPVAGREAS